MVVKIFATLVIMLTAIAVGATFAHGFGFLTLTQAGNLAFGSMGIVILIGLGVLTAVIWNIE